MRTWIDCTHEPAPLLRGHLRGMGGRSPQGETIEATSRYLERNGRPWIPVMAEFHFSRHVPEEWEREIRKIKAAGAQIVSSYIFWNHHEEEEGVFDWCGRRDLRRFIECCRSAGVYAFPRIGPWDHGEVRNGGFPDWLYSRLPKEKRRTDDETYLGYVRRLYVEIARQLKGLYFRDGGPIVGIQVENELVDNAAYLLRLKTMARDLGMEAPLYTVTGWSGRSRGTDRPADEFIPAFGGYSRPFWEAGSNEFPPYGVYFFNSVRNDVNMGDLTGTGYFRAGAAEVCDVADIARYPYITCEMGGGMQICHRRRPIVAVPDVECAALVKLGSGTVLPGYYVFHGGCNPLGKFSTLNESRHDGLSDLHELPAVSYDFQAALGAFGQIRPWYKALKTLHLFCEDFGADLAAMPACMPERQPRDFYDTETLRCAARSRGESGFVFFNNYQNYPGMQAQRDVQVTVRTAQGAITLPDRPFTLEKGAYFFWPFNLDVAGLRLRYATAQPVCRREDEDGGTSVFFKACAGVPAEYAWDDGVTQAVPDLERPLIRTVAGHPLRIFTLTEEQAGNLWKLTLGGRQVLVYSESGVYEDGGRLVFYGESSTFPYAVFRRGAWDWRKAAVPSRKVKVSVAPFDGPVTGRYDHLLFVGRGGQGTAPAWRVTLPEGLPERLHEVLLRVRFTGDVLHVLIGDELIYDEFYQGLPVDIGLKRQSARLTDGILLRVAPLRRDQDIYLDRWPEFTRGEMAELLDVAAVPVYQAIVHVQPGDL